MIIDAMGTRRRLTLAAAVALLIVTAALFAAHSGTVTKACGGVTASGPDGERWHCTFDEEFSGHRLDAARWQVVRTTQYGFHSGQECYVDDGRHVVVGGGVLTLTLTYSGQPVGCGSLSTPYASGMVTSSGRFAQRYGRFEIRAKLPAGTGLQPALWLYPQTETYGHWPGSGEIDIAELFGSSPREVAAHIHYRGLDGQPQGQGAACPVTNPDGAFHTYAVDWTPASISFDYDGTTCTTLRSWTPNRPLRQPAPFDHPFYILLELALGDMSPNLPDLGTALPARMEVDYVRAWGSSAEE